MIKHKGERLEKNDDAHIPVNIFIRKVKHEGKVWWRMSYDLFSPRKGLMDGGFVLVDNRDELKTYINEYVLPAYKLAAEAVTALSEGTRYSFYYWTEREFDNPMPSDEEVLAQPGDDMEAA